MKQQKASIRQEDVSNNDELIVYVHHIGVSEQVLGPGKRVVVWLSGCPNNCPGCIEPEFRHLLNGQPYSVLNLFELIKPILDQVGSITFSGGEPLFQYQALLKLLRLMDHSYEVMLFSGFELHEIEKDYPDALPYIDILIDGRFEIDKQGNYLWRGSENQKIYSPSNKYDDATLNSWMNQKSAGVEVYFDQNEVAIYGIPSKNTLDLLLDKIRSQNIEIER